MALPLSMALCALPWVLSGAHAGTLATAFNDDAGGWTGGAVSAGVLAARDGEVVLAPGAMASFHLATRVRLVEGTQLWFAAGAGASDGSSEATLTATYTDGGGLTLGASTAPLPLGEQVWEADATSTFGGRSPALVRLGASWILYREEAGAVHAARSSDGTTWTELGAVVTGSAADAVVDGGGVALYYACPDVDGVCHATSADGVTFSLGAVLFTTAAAPEVTVTARDAGGWRMWIDDGTGVVSATSADGRSWSAASVVSGPTRLAGIDAVSFTGGLAAVWVGADGVYGTDAAVDADLVATTGDRGPLVTPGFAAWGEEAAAAPALALLGPTWHLWVETVDSRVGHLVGVPTPGVWVGLVVEWDGAMLTATWGTGATLSTPLGSVDAVRLGALGLLEMDEAQLSYTLAAAGDTGDTGDTGGDTGDTDTDTADTALPDTATDTDTDTALPDTDTALPDTDTAPEVRLGAADLSGEPGGCGCSPVSEGGGTSALLALMGLLAVRRRT
jgi:MYXO-CTERM domain-containing protein